MKCIKWDITEVDSFIRVKGTWGKLHCQKYIHKGDLKCFDIDPIEEAKCEIEYNLNKYRVQQWEADPLEVKG